MLRLLAVLLLLLASLPPAHAAESAAHTSPRNIVTLLSDTNAVAAGTPYQLGLRFQLAKGWHIYSRNPGDAGLPPELNWTLPTGTQVGEIGWPTPERLAEGPLMTFSYTGTAMLVMPASGAGPIRLHASWLVCNNICVPEEDDFRLDLPAGPAAPAAQAALFAAAAVARPIASPFQAVIAPDGTLAVTGAGLSGDAVREAWFIPDLADSVVPTGAQSLGHLADGITLSLPTGTAFHADQILPGVLLLRDASGQQTALAIVATPGAVAAPLSVWRAILFALLGGLVLNLMPCVFPVLAMKAMAIARLSAASRAVARREAGAYTLGVVLSFAAIGVTVLVLRRLGHAVGWGFQFQSPIFVAAMAWVLFVVGLNLSGVFAVTGRFAGAGQSLTLRQGPAGSFFAGVLAVLVATPCTAPFMSVALAAAFNAPPVETLAVFLALGLGLAAPPALLSVLPGAGRLLPRPGPWMEILRQALAFPMYAASAWLVWVVSVQAGADGVLACVAGLVLVGFAAWALRLGRRWGLVFALTACLAAASLLPGLVTSAAPSAAEAGTERFTAARLAALRDQGQPVFVNMTAAWCVTCIVNERVALGAADVRAAFAERNVALLIGDWTRQDPEISRFLAAQGRDGVPLYVFYPAKGGAPVVLPQILTPAIVLATVKP